MNKVKEAPIKLIFKTKTAVIGKLKSGNKLIDNSQSNTKTACKECKTNNIQLRLTCDLSFIGKRS